MIPLVAWSVVLESTDASRHVTSHGVQQGLRNGIDGLCNNSSIQRRTLRGRAVTYQH